MTHPSPKGNMVPKAILMRSGLVSLTTARPVNTTQPKTIVNSERSTTNVFNKAHSTVRRPIDNKTATKNSNFNQRVNTISGKNVNTARPKAVVNVARPKAVLNAVKGNQVNALKASACWVWKPKMKQALEEELNQLENIQELLLKLINDLQILNGIPLKQEEQAAKVSSQYCKPPIFYDDDDDYDYGESTIPLNEIVSQIPPSIAITPVLPTLEPEDSLSMGDEHLSTNPEKESDEFIKFSVEDLFPILSESEDTLGSDSECILHSCDDFSPINVYEEKSVTFSNPLFNSNDDFTSSDDKSLSDEDVPEDNVKIYSNTLFEFDDEYIFSDVNPLFDKVLEDIECKDSYDSNLDESTFPVTPLSDSNEDECFIPSDDVELLLYRDSSTPMISVVSILEGFTDEPPLEENDDLFDLESKKNEWKNILYDDSIDDLIFDPGGDIDEIDAFLDIDIPTNIKKTVIMTRRETLFILRVCLIMTLSLISLPSFLSSSQSNSRINEVFGSILLSRKEVSISDKELRRKERVTINLLDAVIQIISLAIVQNHLNKYQKAFIGGSWSDSENDAEDKTNDETCLMAQSSNELRVKKLEKTAGLRTHKFKRLYKVGVTRRVESSDDESLGAQEDASKQGRSRIEVIDRDAEVTLEPVESTVTTTVPSQKSKDKGKAIMIELEKPLKKKDQIELDEELAREIEAKSKQNWKEFK
ncbi:hypothetical protein Tco_1105294 [Tanacetum coccineum]